VLHSIAHPNVAYILFVLGLYGIIFEFANPGINFAGIAGIVCLVLAFVAFAALEASLGGIVLLGLAGILFALDVTAPTHGVLTAGGLLALLAGSLLLFRPGVVSVQLSGWLVTASAVTTGAFAFLVVRAGVRAQRRAPALDPRAVVGQRGRAVTALAPAGVVYAAGEQWSAVTDGRAVEKGAEVVVVDLTGVTLRVRAAEPAKEEHS
jgi:membrane-bound serine protease (ClpP class)